MATAKQENHALYLKRLLMSYYLIGMPKAYLWGFLGFGLNLIPCAGPLAGATLSGLISFVVFDSLSHALLAPVLYTAIASNWSFLTIT